MRTIYDRKCRPDRRCCIPAFFMAFFPFAPPLPPIKDRRKGELVPLSEVLWELKYGTYFLDVDVNKSSMLRLAKNEIRSIMIMSNNDKDVYKVLIVTESGMIELGWVKTECLS
jgi:hypothetical protein